MNPQSTMNDAGLSALFDFSFNRFITLSVVKILYILLIVLACLVYVIGVLGALFSGQILAALGFLVIGAIGILIQIIVWRIMLELIVVIFRIGENTSKLAGTSLTPTATPADIPLAPM